MKGANSPSPPNLNSTQPSPRKSSRLSRSSSVDSSKLNQRSNSNANNNSEPISITRGLSIEDYDPSNPRKITERATLIAMNNLCILKSELKMPKTNEMKSYAEGDEDILKIVINHHQERIAKLISQIKRERQKVINDYYSKNTEQNNNEINYAFLSINEFSSRYFAIICFC